MTDLVSELDFVAEQAVVRLCGGLDLTSAHVLTDLVATALHQHTLSAVILDMTSVTFLDSSGITAMAAARRLCTGHATELAVVGINHRARRALEVSGMTHSSASARNAGRGGAVLVGDGHHAPPYPGSVTATALLVAAR